MFDSESENCWMCNFDLNTDHCPLCGRTATEEEKNYKFVGTVLTDNGYEQKEVTVNLFQFDLRQHHGKCGDCWKKYWDWEMGTTGETGEIGRAVAEWNIREHVCQLESRKFMRKYRKFMNRLKDSK